MATWPRGSMRQSAPTVHGENNWMVRGARWPVARCRAIRVAGRFAATGAGCATSAAHPTLTTHNGANAIANHRRSARAGSVMLVGSQCQPPRLASLSPPSIQALMPYQIASAWLGGRSVRINQGSAYAASQRASRVQSGWRSRVLKQVTRPRHGAAPLVMTCSRGRYAAESAGPYCPCRLMRRNGCHPMAVIV